MIHDHKPESPRRRSDQDDDDDEVDNDDDDDIDDGDDDHTTTVHYQLKQIRQPRRLSGKSLTQRCVLTVLHTARGIVSKRVGVG